MSSTWLDSTPCVTWSKNNTRKNTRRSEEGKMNRFSAVRVDRRGSLLLVLLASLWQVYNILLKYEKSSAKTRWEKKCDSFSSFNLTFCLLSHFFMNESAQQRCILYEKIKILNSEQTTSMSSKLQAKIELRWWFGIMFSAFSILKV